MKMQSYAISGLFILACISGCVTTRSELNRQRELEQAEVPKPEAPKEIQKVDLVQATPTPTPSDLTLSNVTASPEARVAPSPNPVPPPQTAEVRPPLAIPPARSSDLTTLSEDELRAELAKTTGRVEELQHEQELKEKTHADELRKSEERIAALEKQLKELSPDVPKVPEGKSPMEAAKDAYAASNWDEAIVFFSQVLSTEEKGKLAEEATYLRGESHFKKLQYNKAILDFSKFPERFQKSSYHPKALLRIAESFDSMSRKDEAKMFYTDLAEKFPKTAEGRIAKKKLKK
jgi:TolA-binding protein